MKKKLTKHAEIRKNQRGFSTLSLEIIYQFGRDKKAPGDASKIFFGNKEHNEAINEFKEMIKFLTHAKEKTLSISKDNVLKIQ